MTRSPWELVVLSRTHSLYIHKSNISYGNEDGISCNICVIDLFKLILKWYEKVEKEEKNHYNNFKYEQIVQTNFGS